MTEANSQTRPDHVDDRPRSAPRKSLADRLLRWLLPSIRIAPGSADRIKELAEKGSVVYVMRHRSWVDYVLVRYVLRREGLPIPEFVGGLSPIWFRPLREVLAVLWQSVRGGLFFARHRREFEERERCQRLVAAGRPVLLFMRVRPPAVPWFRRGRRSVPAMKTGSDYLRQIVHHQWHSEQEVSLVPVAIFRGRGMRRKDAALQTLFYNLQDAPAEFPQFVSLLWNARRVSISVGVEVALRPFLREGQRDGEEHLVRRLSRALLIFLYREERQVLGPPLLAKRQVRQRVLEDAELSELIARLSRERHEPAAQLWKQADRYFNEMAADFNGLYFSILEFLFNQIWPRIFQGLEYSGLDRVAERVRQHPVVLVPCHRSHFDYLILSYIFHLNYLSPPHIAAGINLSFWPLGPLFRGAGAYFIRRTFDGNELYKTVFRKYLTYLIREGYTQEFFIEGGRSRTGKILTPKLGVLGAIVEAFAQGVRQDLYLVPVSIHYGRIVEEEAYQRELGGAEKPKETLGALIKARAVLRQRYGTVHVTFAEPISLAESLGPARERLGKAETPEEVDEKRRFVQKLGFRLLREVNDVTVPGATSVTATVLLSHPYPAMRQEDFVDRALALTRFLRDQGLQLTASLERNSAEEFRESLSFLGHAGLLQRFASEAGAVLHVPTEKRLALDFYKNNTIHFFLLPALLVDALGRGLPDGEIEADVSWWLELFRWEFPLPERETVKAQVARLREYLGKGAAASTPAVRDAPPDGPLVDSLSGVLVNFREAYWIAARALTALPEGGLPRKSVLEAMRERYRTGLLLGEIGKPEGGSVVTLGNALSRYAEMGCVELRPGKGKEATVIRGPLFDELATIAVRIAAARAGR